MAAETKLAVALWLLLLFSCGVDCKKKKAQKELEIIIEVRLVFLSTLRALNCILVLF
jgi:hypothetical protein